MIRPARQLASEDGAELFEAQLSETSSRSSSFDRQLSEHATSTVSVKNTFIDGFVDEEDDEGAEDALPMVATKSCPAVRMPVPEWGPLAAELAAVPEASTEGAPPQAYLVQYLSSGRDLAPDAHSAPLRPREPMTQRYDALLAQHEQHPPAPSRPSAGPEVVACEGASRLDVAARKGAATAGGVAPLAARQPEMSAGSLLHGAGQCKPCAWFWRPQGCENAAECRHCHLCDAGAIKARRKAKVGSLRTKGAGERRSPHDTKLM